MNKQAKRKQGQLLRPHAKPPAERGGWTTLDPLLRGGTVLGALGGASLFYQPGEVWAWAVTGLGLGALGWGAWREAVRPVAPSPTFRRPTAEAPRATTSTPPRPSPPQWRGRLRLVTTQPQLGEDVLLRLQGPAEHAPDPGGLRLSLHVQRQPSSPLKLRGHHVTRTGEGVVYDLTARLPRSLPGGPVTLSVGRAQCRLPELRPVRALQLRRFLSETEACDALLHGPAAWVTAAQLYGLPTDSLPDLSDEEYRQAFPVTAQRLATFACQTGWIDRHIWLHPANPDMPLIVQREGGFDLLQSHPYGEYVLATAQTREEAALHFLLLYFPWLPQEAETGRGQPPPTGP